MLLAQFFSPRAAEDVLAGRIRLDLGATDPIELPVLTITEEEKWLKLLEERFGAVFAGLDDDSDPLQILNALGRNIPVQLELLRAYDKKKVLPSDAFIKSHVNGGQLMRAVLGVAATAYPPLEAFLTLVTENPEVGLPMLLRLVSALTSSSPQSTDGTSGPSESDSPPSSSMPTSSEPNDVSDDTPKRPSNRKSKPSG